VDSLGRHRTSFEAEASRTKQPSRTVGTERMFSAHDAAIQVITMAI
jgi:hypothetical protein